MAKKKSKVKRIIFGIVLSVIILCVYVFVSLNNAGHVTTGDPIGKYADPKSALLIIDLQRDLTEKTGIMPINPEITDKVIENCNMIIEKNKKLIVVYISHEFDSIIIRFLAGGALKHGEPGGELDPRLKIVSNNRFLKHVSDSFSVPELNEFLVKNQVDHLYIAGVDAKHCVNKTIRGALNRKYKVTVLYDGIGSATARDVDLMLNEFNRLDVDLVSSASIAK